MEIVGLLVIVIIVVMIIFFSLSFTVRQDDGGAMITFQDTKIASQLGTVIAETTVQCGTRERRMRELIIDCAGLREIQCQDAGNSCNVVNNTIDTILQETLAQDLDYSLTITEIGTTNLITNFTTQRCLTSRNIDSFPTPIGSTRGSITIMIRLCE